MYVIFLIINRRKAIFPYSGEEIIKILYINSHSADYVQDLTYSGLVKLLGKRSVIDYKWNKKFHIPYKRYPKNLAYSRGHFVSSLLRSPLKNYDVVFIGSAKVDCFETYLEIVDKIPSTTPVVFIDGGDCPGIGQDLDTYGRSELMHQVLDKRPFDIIFKREYLQDKIHDENIYPLPISFNLNRIPVLPGGYKYDVSFWAVETHEVRTKALNILQNQFDCTANGTVRNQKFSKYKRKGSFYLQELSQCRIVLNLRGGGWDTMRYWEVPAVGAFMITQKPQIKILNDFVNGRDVVHCSDDLTDLVDLCKYYLKHDKERESIARSGERHLRQYHTDVARAKYILEKINGIMHFRS